MLVSVKGFVKRHYFLYNIIVRVFGLKNRMGGVKVKNKGYGKIIKDVIGQNNTIIIEQNAFLDKTVIRIRGNNNSIVFGENVHVGKSSSFWMEGNNINIIIGNNTTFTRKVHFCAQEDEQYIQVGEDCMFSNTIIVRTSDSHPIYNEDGERLNHPKSVIIGKHVWIAPNTKIMKGARLGDGCIIGSNSFVTKTIPPNSLAVGMPAKVVRENVRWTRDKLF